MNTLIYERNEESVYARQFGGNERLYVGNISRRTQNVNGKNALVLGAGGFIGSHLVKRLKSEGYWVRGVDLKLPEFSDTAADDFVIADLRNYKNVVSVMDINFDEIYQLAADMGGAGFVFTGENDFDIIHNSATINLNVANVLAEKKSIKTKIFYSSSACMYPAYNQVDPLNPNCAESSAYPAAPDSEYGWEKLFSEHVYLALMKNKNIQVRIARFHNIFGPEGTWKGGREKSPAAFCRKIAELPTSGGTIDMWGDGEQTRSFLYIDECLEGIRRLMNSDFTGPVNIGSDEMVSINDMVRYISELAQKVVIVNHIDGPLGVRGRNSDNRLISEKLKWTPSYPLYVGLRNTYLWIEQQIKKG